MSQHRLTADKREIKDSPKLPSVTSAIRETLYTISSLISEQCIGSKNGGLNIKKLSKTLFNQLNSYMNKKARPLESSIFNYYFNDSNGDDVLDSLEEYQNSDGGFGRGIEPDFKLIQSSPMATSIGLRYLSMLDNSDRE
ncbi:unnamed protein product, partial [marine sediment metagenome]